MVTPKDTAAGNFSRPMASAADEHEQSGQGLFQNGQAVDHRAQVNWSARRPRMAKMWRGTSLALP